MSAKKTSLLINSPSQAILIKNANFGFELMSSIGLDEDADKIDTVDSVKKSQKLINDNLAAGVSVRFEGNNSEIYEWNSIDRELTRDGVALGCCKVSIKTRLKKGSKGEPDREVSDITVEPDTEQRHRDQSLFPEPRNKS